MICPLCSSKESDHYDQDKLRTYLICRSCSLVYVPRSLLISEAKEFERYDAHENSEESEGYMRYLEKIRDPILAELQGPSLGLDFGCGKTKALERLFTDKGHEVLSYDIYFHPDAQFQSKTYDFIVMSEVIEHLRDPRQDLKVLCDHLRPQGALFIKTKLRPQKVEDFRSWFYKRDITHVQFFSEATFDGMSTMFGLYSGKEIGEDLFMFRKKGMP